MGTAAERRRGGLQVRGGVDPRRPIGDERVGSCQRRQLPANLFKQEVTSSDRVQLRFKNTSKKKNVNTSRIHFVERACSETVF